jgi:hypothetical protein
VKLWDDVIGSQTIDSYIPLAPSMRREFAGLSLQWYTPTTVRRDYPGRELGIIHEIALAGPGPKSNSPQILGKLTRPPRDFPQDLHVKILGRVRLDLGTRPGTSRDAWPPTRENQATPGIKEREGNWTHAALTGSEPGPALTNCCATCGCISLGVPKLMYWFCSFVFIIIFNFFF